MLGIFLCIFSLPSTQTQEQWCHKLKVYCLNCHQGQQWTFNLWHRGTWVLSENTQTYIHKIFLEKDPVCFSTSKCLQIYLEITSKIHFCNIPNIFEGKYSLVLSMSFPCVFHLVNDKCMTWIQMACHDLVLFFSFVHCFITCTWCKGKIAISVFWRKSIN